MPGDAILIAALSARALAEAARRAGFVPLVVDCFGDEDARAAAAGYRQLPHALTRGFAAGSLLRALDALVAESGRTPVGLVLGTGFEDEPEVVAALSQRYRVLGNGADVIRRAKNPVTFFGLLDDMGIAHPETRTDPPRDPQGWLAKRVGSSGGLHIHPCPNSPRAAPGRYFQRDVPGEPISALAVGSTDGVHVVGLTRQWCAPAPRAPYRYGGAVGPLGGDHHRMRSIVETVAPALGLVGLVAFDFLVSAEAPLLLEVNPRPSATLDILDDRAGGLFLAHVRAALGEKSAASTTLAPRAGVVAAAAYLYADRGSLRIGRYSWPDWTRDRPMPGTVIAAHRPVATVTAEAPTAEAAVSNCRGRLGALAEMLYGQATGKDAHQ